MRDQSAERCALILTALEVETRAVLRHMPGRKTESVEGTVFHRVLVEGWDIVVAEVGPGNTPAAIIAERAIRHYGPMVALFVGVAGGIKDVAIGDVVFATKVYGYESGKETKQGFKVRPNLQVTAHALEQQARSIRQQETWKDRLDQRLTTGDPRIYVGPIAAGEKVLASNQGMVAGILREHYGDALAVEMEGRGFLESIHINGTVQGGVIRGISDLLEGKTEADAGGSQERAADAASALAFEILAAFPPKSFDRRQRFGSYGKLLVLLTSVLIMGAVGWRNWNDISEWNLLEKTPTAKDGHLTIAIAKFENDRDRQFEKLLRDKIGNDFQGADALPTNRAIALSNGMTEQEAIAKGTQEALTQLRASKADVILWGSVVHLKSESALRLNWTSNQELLGAKKTDSYPIETIALPVLFWNDLKQVLGLLLLSRVAAVGKALADNYSADRLEPLIAAVRKLRQDQRGTWTSETEANLAYVFAYALQEYGAQVGDSNAIDESIEVYKQILANWTKDARPLDWATAQNDLGGAHLKLGNQQNFGGNTFVHLNEAVSAYGSAVTVWTRERQPIQWAMVQSNLGVAFRLQAENGGGLPKLNAAITAFKAALEILPSDRLPMLWAKTQNNLGNAQSALALSQGDCGGKMPILAIAIGSYGKALTKEKREDVPLEWAKTQNNLGNASWMFAECELQAARTNDAGQSHFKQALEAFDEALKERTQERVPLDWAETQLNMATAYAVMGHQENNESGTENLKQAIIRYRNALEVLTPERTRLLWLKAQTALSQTLTLIGRRKNENVFIQEAQSHVRTIEKSCNRANDTPQCLNFAANLSAALAAMK